MVGRTHGGAKYLVVRVQHLLDVGDAILEGSYAAQQLSW